MTQYQVGDIIERLENKDPFDPKDGFFKNGNTIFLILDITVKKKRDNPTYCLKSLKNDEVFYIKISKYDLWRKL